MKHQEARARERLSGRGIFHAALAAGAFTFIFSGGTPWTTAGTMNAIMGRDIPTGFFTLFALHSIVSFVYAAVIGVAVYRFKMVQALAVGVGASVALYAANFMIFHAIGATMQSPEGRTLITHIVFGLFATLVYKAAGVPRPLESDDPNAPIAHPPQPKL